MRAAAQAPARPGEVFPGRTRPEEVAGPEAAVAARSPALGAALRFAAELTGPYGRKPVRLEF